MPELLSELLREGSRQFPVVGLLGLLAWYAFGYVRKQHADHLMSLEANHARHLASKEGEIRRASEAHAEEVRRLTERHDREVARLEGLLGDARKERDKLLKLMPPGRADG